MVEAQSVLSVGDTIAERYVIERPLGQGGMGAVFVARDERLGRSVALKTLLASASDIGARRLEAEARAVAALDHPGIVTLFDVVSHGAHLVLVLELVDGASLRDLLANGPLEPAEVARVVSATADALDAAHARGFVHRDVKPENLMRRADGRIALLDFGIAKPFAPGTISPAASSLTGGSILGTPAYLAPEQALGEEVVPATDQFALAVVAYELLTGSVPWRTTNLATLVADILMKTAPRAEDARPGLGPSVDAVLSRALEKTPSARYPSVREFADALADALAMASPAPAARGAPRAVNPFAATQTASTAASIPKAARRSLWPMVVGLVVAGAASVLLALRLSSSTSSVPSGRASSTAAPIAPARLLMEELPPSPTERSSAAANYVAAMHALGVGDPRRGRAMLDSAIAEEPRFASALLQRAFVSLISKDALDAPGRAAYRAALTERATLSARDAAFADALAPSFVDPPDWSATVAHLDAFLAERPDDEQGWLARMAVHMKLEDEPAAASDAERVLAVQPKSGLALLFRAQLTFLGGDLPGAQRQLATCVELLPENINCRIVMGSYASNSGACAEAERAGRGLTSLAPENPWGYEFRAAAASARGDPEVAIADLLEQRVATMPEALRQAEAAMDEYRLATRRGDFVDALRALDHREALLPPDDATDRGLLVVSRAQLLLEIGDRARCGAVASEFLERAATRQVPERIHFDPTPTLLAYAREAGAIDDATYRARRDAWAEGWRKRWGDTWLRKGNAAWLMAYVMVGDPTGPLGAGDAREAMEARPRFEATTLPSLPVLGGGDVSVDYYASVGALYLAAGDLAAAKDSLELATRPCVVSPDIRARYLLGLVYERLGDTNAACDAFAAVERAWGHATPTSVTAAAARTHAKSCPPR
ncbi:MAG: protein kinase [Polyangiaceae bacterium]